MATENMQVGDRMPDGSIYLGAHQGRDWFVAAGDASGAGGQRLRMSFNQAATYAATLQAHGHDDWQVPSQDILKEMFNRKSAGAFKGTYDENAFNTTSWYWSSTPFHGPRNAVFEQSFGSGGTGWQDPGVPSLSVRCVRSEPRL